MSKIVADLLNNYHPLTREQEKTATNEELILHNIQFAITQAHKFNNGILTADEVACEALYALVLAAETFDRERGTKFITHASWEIRRRFTDHVYSDRYIVNTNSGHVGKEVRIRKYINTFKQENDREPTDIEICKHMKISKKTLDNLRLYKINSINSIDADVNNEDMNLKDILPSGVLDPCETIQDTEIYSLMNIHLDDIEQGIIYDRCIENYSWKKICNKYKIAIKNAKELYESGINKLRELYNG